MRNFIQEDDYEKRNPLPYLVSLFVQLNKNMYRAARLRVDEFKRVVFHNVTETTLKFIVMKADRYFTTCYSFGTEDKMKFM